MENRYTMMQAAKELEVTKNTLYRWERDGRIAKAKRDRNNFRVYTTDDIAQIKDWKDRIVEPEQQN